MLHRRTARVLSRRAENLTRRAVRVRAAGKISDRSVCAQQERFTVIHFAAGKIYGYSFCAHQGDLWLFIVRAAG